MAQQEQKAPQFGIPVALQEKVKDNYIFVFKDEVPANRVEGLARSMAARAGVKVGYIYKHSIKGFSAQMPASMAERMSADPSVDYYDHDALPLCLRRSRVFRLMKWKAACNPRLGGSPVSGGQPMAPIWENMPLSSIPGSILITLI
ncbi:protease inhibitor I9 family protein [Iodidimonas nitroreducens]|nr:protease inhibitor I9 family protein [Iodidimonas nitroreducens]